MHRAELNILSSGALNSSATTFTVDLPLVGLNQGSYVAIDDEVMFVTSVDAGAKTVNVVRAQLGSVAAAHLAGALVEINPRFPQFAIKEVLKDEIRSWDEHLFAVNTITTAVTKGTRGFELDISPGFYSILSVTRAPVAGDTENADYKLDFHLERSAPTERFPAGQSLVLHSVLGSDVDVLVTVAEPYDVDSAFVDTTDVEEDIGIHAAAHDIPPIGAAWRLMLGREIKRSFGEGQGEPRRAEEIPANLSLTIADTLRKTRDLRLSQERARLRGAYPYRF